MTDQADLPEPQWGDDEPWPNPPAEAVASFPLNGPVQSYTPPVDTRENHIFTISITPNKPPMVVIRGDSGEQVRARIQELHDTGVYLAMAEADQQLQQAKPPAQHMQQQMGATPIGQYPNPQPVQGYGQPMPPANQGQPPFGAPPGGYTPPAQQGWGAGAPASTAPAGWYQVKIPFQAKAEGDALKAQLKAQNLYQGNMKWDGDGKRWLVSPAIVQFFAQWNPMPA